MAHTLTLVAGSTSLALNSGVYRVMKYVPRPPNLSGDTAQAIYTGNSYKDNEPTVTESAVIEISGANAAAIETSLQALESFFGMLVGRYAGARAGSRPFVKYQGSGAAALYRSELLSGSVTPRDNVQDYDRWFSNFRIEVVVAFTRKFYWEADSETQIPITNGNGTNNTAGLAVFNCNDGTGSSPNKLNNYAEIAAGTVTGALPAPVRLALTNNAGTALRRVYVGHKADGSPAAWTHILEAEGGSINATYGTATAVATASGGTAVAVTNVPAAVATLLAWTITDTQAGYALNQWVRPILRFSTRPNNATCSVRVTLKDSTSGAVLARTDYQVLGTADFIQTLPTLDLSPLLVGQTTPGAVQLTLDAKDSAAVCDFTLDFVQLTPLEAMSGLRLLKPIDEALVTVAGGGTGVLIDNMIDGGLYVEDQQGVYKGYGGPIMVVPGLAQRIYFLQDGTADALINRALSVKAYYRPRILTI